MLRKVSETDLQTFFEQQRDPVAIKMAASTRQNPHDREEFDAHWKKLLSDESIVTKTILYNEEVAGFVAKFDRVGNPEITYWIGRKYWGRGITTAAIRDFLPLISNRPLYARTAQNNYASMRVLEKCGFTRIGTDRFYSHARGMDVDEFVWKLDLVSAH